MRQGISYTRARELITDVFRDITDVSKISVHSLTAGGATFATNAGIADRLFKRHGRWASENAKDGYVKDDFNCRLSVTKSLESDLHFIVTYLFIYFCFLNRAQHVGRVLSTGPRFSLSFFRSERGDRGFFILWMIVGSLPGLVFLYLFHRLFLVYTFVVVELACSISARPPVSTR